jgi:transcriptional regulator with XRE-family HTH domain
VSFPTRCSLTWLGPRITRLREEDGISLRELAREAGVSPNTMHRIENGCDTRLNTLNVIAHALGITLEHLLTREAVDEQELSG